MRVPYASKVKRVLIKIISMIIFLFLIVYLQGMHDVLSPPFSYKLEAVRRTLFPASALPYVTFGFDNVIADSYWILAVQDYVQWNANDRTATDSYLDYFRNISTLDPKFEYPYLFSILAIPVRDDTSKDVLDKLSIIVDKGIHAIPTSWQIPFYLATQYYRLTKSIDSTLHYLKLAVDKPDAPPGAYLVYSTLIANNSGKYKTSQALINVIYNNTDNEIIKKIAQLGLQENIITQMLEKGIAAYSAKYKKYPDNIQELLDNKFISLPETFFDIFSVNINKKDGSFKILAK
jgi:hypothetical protein